MEQLHSTQPVWIVMGSDSDLKIMSEAATVLEQFGIGYSISIASAHRCTEYVLDLADNAARNGVKVIIAGAGLAAHLPGVIAAATTLPVIGVPLQNGALAGMDALQSIVQMPSGIPVATVAINGARNAGILAAKILGIYDAALQEKLQSFRLKMRDDVLRKNSLLQKVGYKQYLTEMAK